MFVRHKLSGLNKRKCSENPPAKSENQKDDFEFVCPYTHVAVALEPHNNNNNNNTRSFSFLN